MVKNQLTDVPETMLITLWAKAQETNHPNPILRDSEAVRIVKEIDYDFSRFKKAKFSQVGCCIRAGLIDREIQNFLTESPDAVVVQIGAGIDARYERLGRPKVTHWYDLDLPDAIALRRQLLTESEHNTYLSYSMFDFEWMDRVRSHDKPLLFVIEGVLMYFDPLQVREFFEEVCRRFDDVTVLFDMLAPTLVGNAKYHDSLSKVGDSVQFRWSLLDSHEMESWHPKIHLVKEYFMSDYDQGRYPLLFRILYRIPYFYRHYNQRVVRLHIGE